MTNQPLISVHSGADRMPRHRHEEGYIAVVLHGGYVEAGSEGRIVAREGSVICHTSFSGHMDNFEANGARVLNLPPLDGLPAVGVIAEPDAIAILAENDPLEAAIALREQWVSAHCSRDDWPDLLAKALGSNPDLRIDHWSRDMGLNAASVSRGFRKAYGVSPKRYRLELRVERAIAAIQGWHGSLADLAGEFGFADQGHLARSVRELTGLSPVQLRAKSVQA